MSDTAQAPADVASSTVPLLVDVGLPLASYYLLHDGFGLGLVVSLALSGVLPAARSVFGLLWDRRLNVLATVMAAVNLAGIWASLATSDPRIMIAKGSAVSSVIALAILISAGFRRPFVSDMAKACMTGDSAAKIAAWDRLSADCPRFRRMEARCSVVWGAALLAEGYVRLICAFTLPLTTMAWLSRVLNITGIAVAVVAGWAAARPMKEMIKSEIALRAPLLQVPPWLRP